MKIPAKYIVQPDGTDAQEPHCHHRRKQEANSVGAIMLKGKQTNQNDTRNRYFYVCKTITFSGGRAKKRTRQAKLKAKFKLMTREKEKKYMDFAFSWGYLKTVSG